MIMNKMSKRKVNKAKERYKDKSYQKRMFKNRVKTIHKSKFRHKNRKRRVLMNNRGRSQIIVNQNSLIGRLKNQKIEDFWKRKNRKSKRIRIY